MSAFVPDGLDWKEAGIEKIYDMRIILKEHFCLEIIIMTVIITFSTKDLSRLIYYVLHLLF